MKINVLTDKSGKILGAQYNATSPTIPLPPSSVYVTTRIKPSENQFLYELDIPNELYSHILENTLETELFKYKVEHHEKDAKLVKILIEK